jgi:Flp pilus assembly protein TadB
MKFPTLFTKTPRHKRFSFQPRYYDPQEEEQREREQRIRKELQESETKEDLLSHRSRIAGSFRQAKKTTSKQSDSSTAILRTLILTFLVIWLIAYLHYGKPAIYALFVLVPVYLYFRFLKK